MFLFFLLPLRIAVKTERCPGFPHRNKALLGGYLIWWLNPTGLLGPIFWSLVNVLGVVCPAA
jgi:hypothetical protein